MMYLRTRCRAAFHRGILEIQVIFRPSPGRRPHNTVRNELLPEKGGVLSEVLEQGLDAKVHLLRHHAGMARPLAREITQEEVVGWEA